MNEQVIKDVKRMLLWEWGSWDDDCSSDIWKDHSEFKEIADRYGITKDNIFKDIDDDLKESYEYLNLAIESRECDW